MQRLLFYEPGHFHAALVLRRANPRVAREIHLYAKPGPEREAFLALVAGFNTRDEAPTDWTVELHEGDDPLAALIAERRGALVVLAGRNAPKLSVIRQLHENGFHVLADKPWITTCAGLADLAAVTSAAPIAMDIMTERYDALARLRQRIVATSEVFGELIADDGPTIELSSIHHLCKQVDGRPLRRPEWYYDIRIQGDGLVDIQSHMTDQAQWLIESAGVSGSGFAIDSARRWSTEVSLDVYRESTGAETFPDSLTADPQDAALQLACNGQIDYRIDEVRVRQRAEWRIRAPAGGGDSHSSIVRGTNAKLTLRQGPETGHAAKLFLEANELGPRTETALAAWREDFPGLGLAPTSSGYELLVPEDLRSGHEAHFPMVLDSFLDLVESGHWPEALARRIHARYDLLARAQGIASGAARPR